MNKQALESYKTTMINTRKEKEGMSYTSFTHNAMRALGVVQSHTKPRFPARRRAGHDGGDTQCMTTRVEIFQLEHKICMTLCCDNLSG